jgi:cell wall-associated NlpC family hydrolase
MSVRDEIVGVALWGVRNEPRIHYAPVRPIPLRRTLPLATDCSGFATLCYYLAGAPDPNGLGYTGEGYTGTLLRHLPHVAQRAVRPGDLVVWGRYPGRHCAVVLEPGDDPLLASHGQERGPLKLRFSEEQKAQVGQPVSWLDGLA